MFLNATMRGSSGIFSAIYIGIEARELIKGLSLDFELSLNGRSQQLIALVSGEVLARDKPFDPLQGLLRVPYQLSGISVHIDSDVRFERADESRDCPSCFR